MKHPSTIDRMTLEERVALCSGADAFSTKAFETYGIPSILMADGPHGLRKQFVSTDQLGIDESVPATCFPTASLTACSWDRDLVREMATAIGEEALQEGIAIVLGPGVNIKRNPLCGRNFEYFSEDPYLAGEMAASWIEGLQSTGVAASLKHFAGNSQEDERMASDSLIDERTLHEIYLPAFEKAVKSARPATVMCAYNKVNGTYCSDHAVLLRSVLRDAWGFEGVTLTDWGAMNDRGCALEAGVDLEMPTSNGYFDALVVAAIQEGALSEVRLNESVDRLIDLALTTAARRKPGYHYDPDAHHVLAKKVALNSAVLLKNEEGVLPIREGSRIALIGALAEVPRYQGAGSSHITPTRLSSVIDGFEELGLDYTYYPGYSLKGSAEASLLAEAVAGARQSDVAVIVAGLPEAYESEGFDRATLAMPDSHVTLISRIAAANPNTVVVLVGGAPVEMPWLSQVRAVLNLYLAGQAGGLAAADLLMGKINPSGKLAESYPVCYADVPSAGFYETGGKQAQYREAIYVGYRYYDKARKPVLFPFGHGLSYTTFAYEDLTVSTLELKAPYELILSVTVKNTGSVDGAEVVQVYISDTSRPALRPQKELKGFAKVWLKAGEARRLSFSLDARSFALYAAEAGDWLVPGGVYTVSIGASSRDLRLQTEVIVRGQPVESESRALADWYRTLAGAVTQADLESLLGRPIERPRRPRKGEYTLDCSFEDMKDKFIIRHIVRSLEASMGKRFGGVDYSNPTFKMIMASSTRTPLRRLTQLSPERMPGHIAASIVHLANGRPLRTILSMLRKSKGPELGAG
jgi:beta-glucosidase